MILFFWYPFFTFTEQYLRIEGVIPMACKCESHGLFGWWVSEGKEKGGKNLFSNKYALTDNLLT